MAKRQKQPWIARGKPVYSITKYSNLLGDGNELIDDKGVEDIDSTVSNSNEELIDYMENEVTNLIDVYD